MGYNRTNQPSAVAYIRSLDRDRKAKLDALPPPRANHWVARQKRAVVEAVNSGMLSLREAMLRYELSIEEFQTWQQAFGETRPSREVRERVLELVH